MSDWGDELTNAFPSQRHLQGQTVVASVESAIEAVEDASTVLLLVPSLTATDDRACTVALTPVSPERLNVLWLTLTQSPDERLAVWQEHADELPLRLGVVAVGDLTRSAAVEALAVDRAPDTVDVKTVSDPTDLTRIGIALSDMLSEWDRNSARTVVCVHSLTALLQFVELRRAFRFLHTLKGRLQASDATAHYHMDPEAHDRQTIVTFKPLFDAVIEPSDDGKWIVSTR